MISIVRRLISIETHNGLCEKRDLLLCKINLRQCLLLRQCGCDFAMCGFHLRASWVSSSVDFLNVIPNIRDRFLPAQADSVAEPELPKEPEASCFVGTIPLGISNHSGTRSFHFVRWFGVLGHRMTWWLYMVAIFARQQAPVIAAEQQVGAAERFQLVALLKDWFFGCDEGENSFV